mmetsp:Transcript_7035/g.18029  ORF Transcript_7035/g.18029 Transcript_7035/m.18029 type:complete len:269 (-) Transcript_7035:471-1277(-)
MGVPSQSCRSMSAWDRCGHVARNVLVQRRRGPRDWGQRLDHGLDHLLPPIVREHMTESAPDELQRQVGNRTAHHFVQDPAAQGNSVHEQRRRSLGARIDRGEVQPVGQGTHDDGRHLNPLRHGRELGGVCRPHHRQLGGVAALVGIRKLIAGLHVQHDRLPDEAMRPHFGVRRAGGRLAQQGEKFHKLLRQVSRAAPSGWVALCAVAIGLEAHDDDVDHCVVRQIVESGNRVCYVSAVADNLPKSPHRGRLVVCVWLEPPKVGQERYG